MYANVVAEEMNKIIPVRRFMADLYDEYFLFPRRVPDGTKLQGTIKKTSTYGHNSPHILGEYRLKH